MDIVDKILLGVSAVCMMLLLMLISQHISAHPDDTYNALVDRVVDGDTIDLKVSVWPDMHYKQRVRVYGIDTPEVRTSRKCEKFDGLRASALIKDLLPVGSLVQLEVLGVGKFGRPLGNVKTMSGVDIGTLLIESDLAYPYFGEKKKVWECSQPEEKI